MTRVFSLPISLTFGIFLMLSNLSTGNAAFAGPRDVPENCDRLLTTYIDYSSVSREFALILEDWARLLDRPIRPSEAAVLIMASKGITHSLRFKDRQILPIGPQDLSPYSPSIRRLKNETWYFAEPVGATLAAWRNLYIQAQYSLMRGGWISGWEKTSYDSGGAHIFLGPRQEEALRLAQLVGAPPVRAPRSLDQNLREVRSILGMAFEPAQVEHLLTARLSTNQSAPEKINMTRVNEFIDLFLKGEGQLMISASGDDDLMQVYLEELEAGSLENRGRQGAMVDLTHKFLELKGVRSKHATNAGGEPIARLIVDDQTKSNWRLLLITAIGELRKASVESPLVGDDPAALAFRATRDQVCALIMAAYLGETDGVTNFNNADRNRIVFLKEQTLRDVFDFETTQLLMRTVYTQSLRERFMKRQ